MRVYRSLSACVAPFLRRENKAGRQENQAQRHRMGLVKSYGQFCGLARALDHVGDRWTLLIVRELLIEPRRYSQIRDALPGVATNLLADRLRSLEADGL